LNGFCTRTDTLVIEDRYGRRGWSRTDAWDECGPRWRGGHGHGWHGHPSYAPPGAGGVFWFTW
jgi:hypothetical protein